LINEAYAVENGDSGIAFKITPRLLDVFDCGMKAALEEGRVIAAYRAGERRSAAVGCIVWELQEKCIYFGPLAISPLHQKLGIGRELMDRVGAIGIREGRSVLEISVVNHRTDIIPLYEKMGFVKVSEGEFPNPERLSRPAMFFIMQKQLV
jgi:GNAT superfamily N-acetyltransferase